MGSDGNPVGERSLCGAGRLFFTSEKKNSWEIKTVRTLLSRLVEKGAVGYDQIGNSYLYRTEFSRDQLVCGEIRNVANRILNGSVSAMFASFIREEQLEAEEIEHLRQLLEERSEQ